MGFVIAKGDLLELKYDALVIPSQPTLKLEGNIGGKVKKIGGNKLQFEIKQLHQIAIGECIIVNAYNMKCKKLLLVANPEYFEGKNNEEELLQDSYYNCLDLAATFDLESIAFPLLSTGTYHFPRRKAIEIALSTINDYLEDNDDNLSVALVIYDKNIFDTYRNMFKNYEIVGGHLSDKVAHEIEITKRERKNLIWYGYGAAQILEDGPEKTTPDQAVRYFQTLHGLTDAECYSGVLSKNSFSKIVHGKAIPSKYTLIALGINMELRLDEIITLLKSIGVHFVEESLRDNIIVNHLIRNIDGYNIDEINNQLTSAGFPPLTKTRAKDN